MMNVNRGSQKMIHVYFQQSLIHGYNALNRFGMETKPISRFLEFKVTFRNRLGGTWNNQSSDWNNSVSRLLSTKDKVVFSVSGALGVGDTANVDIDARRSLFTKHFDNSLRTAVGMFVYGTRDVSDLASTALATSSQREIRYRDNDTDRLRKHNWGNGTTLIM